MIIKLNFDKFVIRYIYPLPLSLKYVSPPRNIQNFLTETDEGGNQRKNERCCISAGHCVAKLVDQLGGWLGEFLYSTTSNI